MEPRHRRDLALPGPWPACAQELLRAGSSWLHTGLRREDDEGGDLLILPGGPILASHWDSGAWGTTLDGVAVPGSPWEALEAHLHLGPWIGAATYELACVEADLPHKAPDDGVPGMHWQAARSAIRVKEGRAELWGFEETPPSVPDLGATCALGRARGALHPRWDEVTHRAAVETIRDLIRDGAFYVANLCMPFESPLEGDLITLALAAFRKAKPPYGALLDLGGRHLLSLSMERLLSRHGDRLRGEPIKGTVPLLGDEALDAAAGAALRADPKERAEHAMIVDLVRNDLGRVSAVGSVAVPRFMEVERFPTVQHLVSRVEAVARPGLGLTELLRSALPGGSVTGAPKHAVCGHLAKAEAAPRGFYCGALGWIGTNGDLDLALPIRTAEVASGRLTYWAGGGITLLSEPAKEWRELEIKTRAIAAILKS
ncbi:MAG TPA: anthranilate synthase component I family protein [Holophagaceae bacterium]|jgi:anthranilate/para-aminobenzoate synthase component I|nr:anthranilate synthase component I family protein [Holophagaceae bacterium]